MEAAEVTAIVYGAPEDPVAHEVMSAVAAQSRAPGQVIAEPVGLAGAVERAGASAAEWLWLLDGAAVPAPDALEALLGAAEGLLGAAEGPAGAAEGPAAPVLLSSKVLGPDGGLDPASLPRHVIYATDISVAAAEHRLVQIRAAGSGSVLVWRRGLDGVGRARGDMLDLSARLLRSPAHVGYLVPSSVATRRRPAATNPMLPLRMLASRAWTPREKLREGFLLTRRLASARRAGPSPRRPAPPARTD